MASGFLSTDVMHVLSSSATPQEMKLLEADRLFAFYANTKDSVWLKVAMMIVDDMAPGLKSSAIAGGDRKVIDLAIMGFNQILTLMGDISISDEEIRVLVYNKAAFWNGLHQGLAEREEQGVEDKKTP